MTQMVIRLAALLVMAGLAMPGVASGQIQQPIRDYDGVFGGARTRPGDSLHQLTLDATLMGGYDDDIGSPETSFPINAQFSESSTFGEANTGLTYRYGREERYVRLTGTTVARTYSALDYEWQVDGGGGAEFYTRVGRDSTFRAGHRTGYTNYFVVGNFGVLTPNFQPDLIAATGPSFAVAQRRAFNNDSTANFTHAWTPGQSTDLSGSFHDVRSLDTGFEDLQTTSGGVAHTVSLSRTVSVGAGYSYTRGDYGQFEGEDRRVTENRADGSVQYIRRLSATRNVALSAGAGATRMDSTSARTNLPVEFWSTSASASAATDLARSWAIRGSYFRGWTLEDGFDEPFFSDSTGIAVGGFLNRRTDLIFSAGYSRGQVGFSNAETYESWTGAVQSRYAMSRHSALFASYVYYFYSFSEQISLPEGLPSRFDRQVVRVGVSFWVPLAGVFQRTGERP